VRTTHERIHLLPVRTSIPASVPSRNTARAILKIIDRITRVVQRITRTIEGAHHLDEVGSPFIIASNHVSLLDTPTLHLSMPRRYSRRTAVVGGLDFFAPRRGWSWHRNAWRRVVVWFLRSSMNVVLIDRHGGDYSNLDQIEGLLRSGWNLIIFPEATRSRTGELGRLHLGVAELAHRHGCPVLPCKILGTNEVLPIGRTIPQHGAMTIRIGRPIEIDLTDSTRDFVKRIGDSIQAIDREGANE
jgi:1-acyl-sn-glycerol-3-phosphate acyltransferase